MPRSRPSRSPLAPVLLAALAAPCAMAQNAPPTPPAPPATPSPIGVSDELWEPGRWTLQLEPGVWFASMGGDIQAGNGAKTEFRDIDGDADSAHTAASLRGMYRKDRLTVLVDGFYLDFNEGDAGAGSAVDFTLWSADASVGWEVWEWKRQRMVGGEPRDTGLAARLVPYAGLRVIAPDFTVTAGGGSDSGSQEFIHPLVGLRVELEIFDRFSIDTGADVGAFDLLGEDAFAFDWSLGIRVNVTENIAAQIGFRQMFMDLESDDVLLDGSAGGLMAAVTIRF